MEIEETLRRYKCEAFQSGWNQTSAFIEFSLNRLRIRFLLPYPNRQEKALNGKQVRGYWKAMTPAQKDKAYEQALRQRWRALALVVKAKLEAVDCGISTIECEFMANVIVPGTDKLVGQWFVEHLPVLQAGGGLLALPKPE